MNKTIIIDGTNATLGRLASFAAKQALLGKTIHILNCNKVVITGNPRTTINDYQIMRQRGGSAQNGPNFPRTPERIVKRTIRGMLSHRQGRGWEALKRIRSYNETPKEFSEHKSINMENPNRRSKFISLLRLQTEL